MAPINSTSWQVSEDKRVPIHHYIKDSEFWRCRVCRVCTPNHLTEECLNGHVPRIVRALDGDESCSSYDEESFASSSSDSSDYDSDLSGSDNGQCTDSMSPAKLSPTKKKQMTQDELEEKLKKLPKVSVSVTQITFSSIKELVEYRRKKCNELKKLRTLGYGIGIFSETDQAHVRVHHRLKGKEADEERLEYLRRCNKRLPNTTGKFIASCDKVNTQKNNRIKKTGITAGEKIPVPAFLNTKDSDDLEAESFISSSSESESDFTSSDSYYA